MKTTALVVILCGLTACVIAPVLGQKESEPDRHGLIDWVIGADSRPLFEVSAGLDQPKHKKFAGEFTGLGFAEARLGYSTVRGFRPGIIELDDRVVYAAYSSDQLGTFNATSSSVPLEVWTFGIANRSGFGWDLGPFGLIPFHRHSMELSTVDYSIPQAIDPADSAILDRYSTSARFGNTTEAGLQLAVSDLIGINLSYQGQVISPRFVFWEWFGSYILAGIAVKAISDFGEDIVERSPVLGPILYFILRNGVAFAVYALWRNEVNWPFHSETPLTRETARLGVSLAFP